ncbi:type IV pilus modification PilV family protein [Rehaibacterium terrae]|uniref:Tfp pilus assembly protein PilV n=1 Tax=Rehaibacterium terrae TaxID=1341696 RepID=A0A7W7XZA6_9GAMM|nr:prepilin-type N-terminal cleavage/methylation domain-containing protein [Rehaibacterium terrae]MBB5015190.1 Tfp pilus assembly protein PilV [Rehaibacterium terrae]
MRRIAASMGSRERGLTLIEAMIAVVILATGLLALAALQSAIIRNSADAKVRSVMMAYAQGELDRLRLAGAATLANSTKNSATIADPNDPLRLAVAAAGLASAQQTVTVTQFVYNQATGVFEQSGAAPGDRPYFKRVDMQLAWTDATGGARNLQLSTAMSVLALGSSPVLVDRQPSEDSSQQPVIRRPSPVTEGMIPIALGDGQETAATNPRPQLVGRDRDTLVADTRFEVLTYDPNDNLGDARFARINKRIETALVGCTCQTGLGGFPTGGNSPNVNVILRERAFRPTYWDGTSYTSPKPAGTPVSSPSLSVQQSELCNECCRDHRDQVGVDGAKFNPWSATHDHYDAEGNRVASGTYVEACRLIRVDGLWRVAPDPRLDDLSLVATRTYPETTGSGVPPADNNRATAPQLSEYGKNAYLNFAYQAVKALFFDRSTFDRESAQADSGLNQPDYIPIKAGDRRWLHARGLLRDYLEPPALARLDKAKESCTAADDTGRAQCVLPFSPMATVNVTELAVWSGTSGSSTGLVPPLGLESNYALASMRRYPSALALVSPISPFDGDGPLVDEQLFLLSAGTVPSSSSWLQVASPTRVLFGDPNNPSRGFATMPGGHRFTVNWSGVPRATNNNKSDDPSVEVGRDSSAPCDPSQARNTSNPYSCRSATTSAVELVMGGYNYLRTASGNINNPCPGAANNDKIGQGQAKCVAYTLTGLQVDGALVSPLMVTQVGAAPGTPGEKILVTLPSIRSSPLESSVTISFSESERNATAVCQGSTFTGWSCD